MKNLSILEARKKLLNKEITATQLAQYYLNRIDEKDGELNAYLTVEKEKVLEEAKIYDDNPELLKEKKLGGIPLAIKDAYSTKGLRTTGASKILDNYEPPFDATVVKRIKDEGAIILGKTNLDQFCHGSSTITSGYGPTRNPWDITKLPGGSSGGSAAATTADMCPGSLGTETAGSIRLPSSWCGLVGLKPSYGRVPRYGITAMGSSLDSPGPMVKTVEDAAYLLSIIAGEDENDFTTSKTPTHDYHAKLDGKRIKGMKIGLPKEYMELELEDGVRKNTEHAIEVLKSLGAEIVEINLMDPKYSIATYTLVQRSEVSSNLGRYDGIRYGPGSEKTTSVSEYIENSRGEGFGEEPKRRVMTGTFALSAGYADEYYKKSEQVRQKIKDDIKKALEDVDVIIGPTTPSIALSDKEAQNPLFGELADVLVEASSMSGLPGISVPSGLSEGLPTGLNIVGALYDEQKVLDVAYAYEKAVGGFDKYRLG